MICMMWAVLAAGLPIKKSPLISFGKYNLSQQTRRRRFADNFRQMCRQTFQPWAMSLKKKLVNTLIYLSRRSQLEVLYIKAGGNNAESFKIDSGFEVFHILFSVNLVFVSIGCMFCNCLKYCVFIFGRFLCLFCEIEKFWDVHIQNWANVQWMRCLNLDSSIWLRVPLSYLDIWDRLEKGTFFPLRWVLKIFSYLYVWSVSQYANWRLQFWVCKYNPFGLCNVFLPLFSPTVSCGWQKVSNRDLW